MIYIGVIYLILRLAGQIIMAAVEDDDWIIIDKNIKNILKLIHPHIIVFFMEIVNSFSYNTLLRFLIWLIYFITFYKIYIYKFLDF
jgi:hypothetical protein